MRPIIAKGSARGEALSDDRPTKEETKLSGGYRGANIITAIPAKQRMTPA